MENDKLHYLAVNSNDEDWGIVVTTVGYQFISPKDHYPLSKHPVQYDFKPQKGRILNEYQLVYITKGCGYFSSQSVPEQRITAGTMILLFPGEWHSYHPDKETGWDEYWVGFRGQHIDRRVEKHFFSKQSPVYHIGISANIVDLYEEILQASTDEKSGYQEMISSIVLHILGSVYYMSKNNAFSDSYVVEKINEARLIIKQTVEEPLAPEEIAHRLGLSYSWFRRTFKEYTGISPAQYQMQQKLLKSKELLTGTLLNISEIAYALKFENAGQFSTFFKKKEGMTPSDFRDRAH